MLATINSGAVYGVDAYAVEIEVNNSGVGDPKMVIVGLPDAAVKESRDRVRTALHNSGFPPVFGRTTVNLAPANMKKEGPNFDLPIAVGVLTALGELDVAGMRRYALIGELALSGEIRRVRGVLPIALCLRDRGCAGFIVPEDNADEAAVVGGLDVYPVRCLHQAVELLQGKLDQHPYTIDAAHLARDLDEIEEDYAEYECTCYVFHLDILLLSVPNVIAHGRRD